MKKHEKIFSGLVYRIYLFVGTVIFAGLALVLSSFSKLEQIDQQISDVIFQGMNYQLEESKVSIIAIDDKTIEALGEYESWSRQQTADVITLLNESEYAPAVIGLGLDYSAKKDEAGDAALAEVCSRYDNLCFSARAKWNSEEVSLPFPSGNVDRDKGLETFFSAMQDEMEILVAGLALPYPELLDQVSIGVINNLQPSADGYVRNAITVLTYVEKEYDSFAFATYRMYKEALGEEVELPKVDENNAFSFIYTRKSKDYDIYSFYDVMSGKVDLSVFDGRIVYIGDYASDFQGYLVPNQRSIQMKEIEVQANIVEAFLNQRTGQGVSYSFMAIHYALFAAIFFIATSYSSQKKTVFAGFLLVLVQVVACVVSYLFGYYILILIPSILIVMITLCNLFVKYLMQKRSNYRLEHAFKKYVDKSIVNEIVQNGGIDVHVGGLKRDIAVLFVDIRGFTSISETLPPEKVVEILNKYLSLAAAVVSQNKGTLDKFIGDAAMALFNAPNDLEDYEYRAVCAAWELLGRVEPLCKECQELFGKQVGFGIGIHCGEAIVGNIGGEARMDYTAIGDTVNLASRLEGVALPGHILISKEMKERLGRRISASYAGEFHLKGKKDKVPAYMVNGIEEQQAEEEVDLSKDDYRYGRLYCIPSLQQLEEFAEFSEKYGAAFEYNDFFLPNILDDEQKVKEIMGKYMALERDRSEDTLHGAFLDVCVNSGDAGIFAISDKRVHQSMDIAKEMGLKAVIFHTNYIPNFRLQSYLNDWLNKNEAYWRNILKEYPMLRIYMENMFDEAPWLLVELAERMKDEPRFSVCLDTAHAYISGSALGEWFEQTGPYVKHIHINDNNQYEDLHLPIGSGKFPWEEFQRFVMSLDEPPSVLIEVRCYEDLLLSVEFMKENGIYPFGGR